MPNPNTVSRSDTPSVPPDWRELTTVDVPVAGLIVGGLCRNAAYNLVRRGEIPSIRLGRKVVVPVVPLRRMIGELPEVDRAEVAS